MLSRSIPVLVALGAAACTLGCSVGTEGPGSLGYVLLDPDARAAGTLTQDQWSGAPVLPVALDVSEPVAFASSAGRTVFDLRAGSLAWIHGAGGAVEWLDVGGDVGPDRLIVYAGRESADKLAARLAGQVVSGEGGRFTIQAPEIFERASFMSAPDGVVEIVPYPAKDAPIADGRGLDLSSPLPGGASAAMAALVGVYVSGSRAVVLDAMGMFSIEDACSGEVTGRGRFRIDGDRVVLGSDSAEDLDVTVEGGALRFPNGSRFAPLPAADAAAEPGGAP